MIKKVTALDPDLGRNSDVSYFLDDSHDSAFSVGRVDGIVRADVTLDREEKDQYEITVIAMDNGSPK